MFHIPFQIFVLSIMPNLKFVLPGGKYLEPTAHNFPLAKCINFKSSLFKSYTKCSETLFKHQHTCIDHSLCIVGSGRARKYAPEKCGTCLSRMLQAQTSTRYSGYLLKHISLLRTLRKRAGAKSDEYFFSKEQYQWFYHYVPRKGTSGMSLETSDEHKGKASTSHAHEECAMVSYLIH